MNEQFREEVQAFARKKAAEEKLLGSDEILIVHMHVRKKRGWSDFEKVRQDYTLRESDREILFRIFGTRSKKRELVQKLLDTGNEPLNTDEVATLLGIPYVGDAFIGTFNGRLSQHDVPIRLRFVNRTTRGDANFVRFYREE